MLLTKSKRKYPKALFIVSIVFLLVVILETIAVQSINPLCAGIGDPNLMACRGGFVSTSEAFAIMKNKLLSDLVLTVGIPVIISLGLAFIAVYFRNRGNARVDKPLS